MSIADLTAPVLGLLRLVRGLRITGPDEHGHVWAVGGDRVERVDLGHIGTPAAEAGLRWRAQTAEVPAGDSPDERSGPGGGLGERAGRPDEGIARAN